jgi:putative lipoic acid-binding regulatory protein
MSLPARELLEAVHQFPCPFVFKAVGRADGDFIPSVVAAVRQALGHDFDSPFETRETPGGRHVAVTVTPIVHSADEVLAVYLRIRDLPGLVMLL